MILYKFYKCKDRWRSTVKKEKKKKRKEKKRKNTTMADILKALGFPEGLNYMNRI